MNYDRINIVETTLRDGSYVANFGFSASFTHNLARCLDGLGIAVIEVGHGVGLGADRKVAPSRETDVAYIAAARSAVRQAEIAAFCIPGIAELDHMAECIDAGLQIVRVGANVSDYATMAPFIERARAKGARPFANLMKSYLVDAEAMGAIAKSCAEMGAEAVFVVDSAGGMTPKDVTARINAITAETAIPVGFHGHNNLGLAVANSLAAIDAGAKIVDTTLLGLGRSSGNAPTEAVVALLQKHYGQALDIDLCLLMELADRAVLPLLRASGSEGAITVALGHAQVHSGFLPAIQAAAESHDVQLFDLVRAVGARNRLNLKPDDMAAGLQDARSNADGRQMFEGIEFSLENSDTFR